jgi:adenine phosphoribosyltransferase
MHRDGVQSGQSLIIIDDLIATGGTATAACELVEAVGAKVSALGFVIALDFIPWRDRLGDREVRALLRYS